MFTLIKLDTSTYSHIAVITLNRPEAANALNKQLLEELQLAIKQINDEQSVFCTIITGEGSKAFCAGADLKERQHMNEHEVVKAVQLIGDTILKVEQMRMPVIAALNGVAFGGGLELALACDLRIAANDIKLGLTETSLAIIPGAGGTQRLPRLIGIGKAKKLIYTANRINANEAKDYGIIEDVVPNNELFTEALRLANKIVKNGPIALEQAKVAIDKGTGVDLMTGLAIEQLSYKATIQTKDRLEGLQAFQEKRQPIYRGK